MAGVFYSDRRKVISICPSFQLRPPSVDTSREWLAEAVSRGELRADTDVQALARMIEVTLGGSFLAWTLHREGSAATRFREDLDFTLRPYLTHAAKAVK
jgi:hypothetical protein